MNKPIKAMLVLLSVTTFYTGYLLLFNVLYAISKVFTVNLPLPPLFDDVSRLLATVDLSTVTPLVIFITLFYTTKGILELIEHRKKGKATFIPNREHYPFFPSYRSLFVQLGLLGTIFAFIIAFQQISVQTNVGNDAKDSDQIASEIKQEATNISQASYDPGILIAPLGTALWSTFAGVFIAFVGGPFIENRFKKFLTTSIDKNNEVADDLKTTGQAFKTFGSEIENAGKAVGTLTTNFQSLQLKIDHLDKQLVNQAFTRFVESTEKINTSLANLTASTNNLNTLLGKTEQAIEKYPAQVEKTARLIESLGGVINQQQETIKTLSKSMDNLKNEMVVGKSSFNDFLRQLGNTNRTIDKVGNGIVGQGKEIGNLTTVLGKILDEFQNLKASQIGLAEFVSQKSAERKRERKREAEFRKYIRHEFRKLKTKKTLESLPSPIRGLLSRPPQSEPSASEPTVIELAEQAKT